MLTGFVLSVSGFVPNIEQTEDAKHALLVLYALFPLVCYIGAALIFTRFSLDEDAYRKIRQSLDGGTQVVHSTASSSLQKAGS